MTQAKAATVAAAIISAGYSVSAHVLADGTWVIRSQSNAIDVPVGVVAAFVTAQGIIGKIADVEYS